MIKIMNAIKTRTRLIITVSPVAYKLASNSAMIKSLVLLIIKCMIVLGTKSRVVFVTIFM